ncbi:pyrroline-5-carboxylate reductase [Aureimonas psammosilenae]|uniref:pyrroline-5-carboxylate reductase n=1 Tax=Aureimonas psammosilenae TaxID=2495496 RepID=UPI0012612240|nr:pyrroline-5-carboxylate reductase [Aureimonas psammosilenae]
MSDSLRDIGRVLLVGAGNMGGAMARGWVGAGARPSSIHVVDPRRSEALEPFFADGSLVYSAAVPSGTFDIVVLAVKPQMMGEALPALRSVLRPDTLVISVAAGTTTATIASLLGDVPVVRAMPNTPALIGRGITGCFGDARVSARSRRDAEALLIACGSVLWVEREADIDAVTAVSGSGPAYVFLLAETLASAGEAVGLSRDLALTLARHTVAGAGELMIRSEDEPSTLRRNVTSPNGTTQAALDVLMAANGLGPLMRDAVAAAARRAAELAGDKT